ncbi:MAG: tripartite tricarboxylate transporter substrate binding protein [Xanthobacteraceae bacterium]
MLAAVGALSGAQAQSEFPNKAIQIVLPYPAGGIVDNITRVVTNKLATIWKHPIVIEPKPGANGNIAWDQVMRAKPDGYTWSFYGPAIIANSRIQDGVTFSEKNFVPIGGMVWVPWVLVVHPSVPASTVKEFVDYVRANPGKLNVANGGTGSSGHLNTAIFLNATKLKMEEIQYRGQPPALLDLVAGRVQFALASPSLVVQYIQSGKLKALGVVAQNRLPQLPDVPTMSEVGYPETNVVAWYGLCAPKDTPADIVEKIVSGVNEALKDPAVRTALESQMTQVMEPTTPAKLQALVESDTEKYAKIIKEANIKVQ